MNIPNMRQLIGYCLLFMLVAACQPLLAQSQSPPALKFGIQGVAQTDLLETIWGPFAADMSEAINHPVELALFEDYLSAVDALRTRDIDLAWLGNRSAIIAVDTADVDIFAQVLHSYNIPGYNSLLITRKDSQFNSFDDVISNQDTVRFGLGNKTSTSGTTVPMYYLFAKQDFSHLQLKNFRHANHETNFLEVASGQLDVSTMSSGMLERFSEVYPQEYGRIRIIWTSPIIPSDPFVWRSDLPAGLKSSIKDFLVNYGKPTQTKSAAALKLEKDRLQTMKWSGFALSNNKQLKYIRILDLFGQLQAVKSDDSLPKALREDKIQSLQDRLKQLEAVP